MQKKHRRDIAKLAEQVSVYDYLHYRDYLFQVYQCSKKQFESYSYLKFADDLGFSETNVLRLIIAGKRPLTHKAAGKITEHLNLTGSDRQYWLQLVDYNNSRSIEQREQHFNKIIEIRAKQLPSALDKTQLEYFQEWFYPIIREMAGLKNFEFDSEWIQKHLNFPLRLEQIKKAMTLLVELKLIIKNDKSGILQRSEEQIRTGSEVQDLAVISYHQKMIDAAKDSITRIHEKKRDISAATVCLSEQDIQLIKTKINQLMNDILELERNTKNPDHVYQVNVQFFPFTKG